MENWLPSGFTSGIPMGSTSTRRAPKERSFSRTGDETVEVTINRTGRFLDDEDCAFDILHSRAWAPGKKSSFVIIDTYASRRGGVSMLFLFLLLLRETGVVFLEQYF